MEEPVPALSTCFLNELHSGLQKDSEGFDVATIKFEKLRCERKGPQEGDKRLRIDCEQVRDGALLRMHACGRAPHCKQSTIELYASCKRHLGCSRVPGLQGCKYYMHQECVRRLCTGGFHNEAQPWGKMDAKNTAQKLSKQDVAFQCLVPGCGGRIRETTLERGKGVKGHKEEFWYRAAWHQGELKAASEANAKREAELRERTAKEHERVAANVQPCAAEVKHKMAVAAVAAARLACAQADEETHLSPIEKYKSGRKVRGAQSVRPGALHTAEKDPLLSRDSSKREPAKPSACDELETAIGSDRRPLDQTATALQTATLEAPVSRAGSLRVSPPTHGPVPEDAQLEETLMRRLRSQPLRPIGTTKAHDFAEAGTGTARACAERRRAPKEQRLRRGRPSANATSPRDRVPATGAHCVQERSRTDFSLHVR